MARSSRASSLARHEPRRSQLDLHLSALLLGQLEADIRFGRGSSTQLRGKGVVGVGLSGPYADDFLLSLPAAQAITWLPLPVH